MVLLYILFSLLALPRWGGAMGPQVSPTNCQLTWAAPTNPDGTPVADLHSYRVYLTRTSGDYDFTTPLAAPAKEATTAFCATLGALPTGQWYLVMKSADTAGNLSDNSLEVPFEVVLPETADVTPPVVQITSPMKGDVVPRKTSVPIEVTASDDSGVITDVVIFVNRASICRVTTPPYQCLWLVPAGSRKTYVLQASAGDAAGHRGLSPTIQVRSE